jgi:non-ribosomal peptide synthase protein (TIGR01720 family)
VDACAELLRPDLGLDLRDVLYPRGGRPEEAAGRLRQTFITQPALFVVEYALARLWMSWGVRPRAMIGHSIGEYVAACLAGVFSLEDALTLVAARGRLMQELPGGSMLAVPLPEGEARRLAGESLSLASVNGPSLCVVSGPTDEVEALARRLEAKGVNGRRLQTSHAFHSRMMEPILGRFAELVRGARPKAPQIPYLSNLTGTWAKAEDATDADYWARHLRETVRFADGAQELMKGAERILLEVGPGQTLTALTRQHPAKAQEQVIVPSLPRANEGRPEAESLLSAAAGLWLAGLELDWQALHSGRRPRRVPLPTYPFERSRYWIDPAADEPADAQTNWRRRPDIAQWFYAPLWKQSLPPAPAIASAASDEGERRPSWLLFTDECGLGDELAKSLRQDYAEVVRVSAGEAFEREGDSKFVVNPRRQEDFKQLLAELNSLGKLPDRVVHLWGVTHERISPALDESSEQTLAMSFYSLLFLAQALGEQVSAPPVQVFVCSNNMQKVFGEEVLYPEKAAALGPCKVIPQEYPNVACRSVDLLAPPSGGWAHGAAVRQLLAEFAAPNSDPVVAYRGGARWVPIYEPLTLDAAGAFTRLREGGVYLITGGLGGIGLEIAEHLASSVGAKLILTGRSAFPARDEWEQRLADSGEDDEVGRKIRRLKKLEEQGGEVLVFSADAADLGRMREVLAQAAERFGPVNGVVHAAGVAGDGMIQAKTPEVAAGVLAPKVRGTRVLEALLKGAELDFLLLCSSVSSVLGGIGQVDYAAANFFLDAFAHYDSLASGRFTASVNWITWQEVGMAVDKLGAVSADARRPARGRQVGHPMLERCVDESPEHKTYSAELSVARHWVLDEHRLAGNAVLPGTAYLEIARAAFEDYDAGAAVELRNLYFLNIMRVGEDERREVQTVIEKNGRGLKFVVRSDLAGAGSGARAPRWEEHAVGELRRVEGEPAGRYDIEELLARCDARRVEFPERGQHGEGLGPRWDNVRSLHVGDGELLAAIELPGEFSEDLSQFALHPSLLDVATGLAKQYLGDGAAYLPLSYERVRVNRPLSGKFYSYAKASPGSLRRSEVMSYDILLLDERGDVLVEIEGFSAKRVDDAALLNRAMAGQSANAAVAEGAESPAAQGPSDIARAEQDFFQGVLAGGIRSAEGVEAFGRILARGSVPQIVVSPVDIRALIEQANSMTATGLIEQAEKLRLNAPRAKHPRPELDVPYVAPRDETERLVADIWQELLGLEQVGVDDNFFELGGDSVVVIYLVARLTQAGLQFSPQHIFQYPTVAELSAAAAGPSAQAEQEQASGPVPLAPGQRWFFAQDFARPEQFTNALWLETRSRLDASLLKEAVRQLWLRHDALRVRFEREESEWRQVYTDDEDALPFTQLDLSALEESERASACEQTLTRLAEGMSLSQGPLFHVALFDFGEQSPGRVLIVAHQLLADGQSWRILLEDLETAYRLAVRGDGDGLPPKTASFQRWSQRVEELAPSAAGVPTPGEYPEGAGRDVPPLPSDYPPRAPQPGAESPTQRVSASLGAEETAALLEQVPRVFHTRTEEVLAAALVETLGRRAGVPSVALDLSAGMREAEESEGMNLARTLGRLDVVLSARLNVAEGSAPTDWLKSAKEQLRALSARPLRHAAAHYNVAGAAGELQSPTRAEVSFNYRGRVEELLPDSSLFAPVPGEPGLRARPERRPGYRFEINGYVLEEKLRVEWAYDASLYRPETVERLAADLLEVLRAVVDYSQSSGEEYTPSDFPLAGLDEQKLSKLSSLLGKVSVAE